MDEQIRYRGKTYSPKEINEIKEVVAAHRADGLSPERLALGPTPNKRFRRNRPTLRNRVQ